MRRLLAVLVPSAASLILATTVSGGSGTTYADVAPILNDKCAGCHSIGGVAPLSLASARDAHAHAPLIKAATQAPVMPPWAPRRDSKPVVRPGHPPPANREADVV